MAVMGLAWPYFSQLFHHVFVLAGGWTLLYGIVHGNNTDQHRLRAAADPRPEGLTGLLPLHLLGQKFGDHRWALYTGGILKRANHRSFRSDRAF